MENTLVILTENSVENDRQPVPDPQKTIINVTREPSDAHKKPSKRKS
jgi:hypothetical protein